MAENNETRLNNSLFKQHQKFGFDIMEYLADFFEKAELEKIDKQAVDSIDGCYQQLTFPDQSSIRYTSWNTGQPFYIILYKSPSPKDYILELDLTRLVCIEDRFTWYLARPHRRNIKTREILESELVAIEEYPKYYVNKVKSQKKMFIQGERVYKGFLLIKDGSWEDLLKKLGNLISNVCKRHSIAKLSDENK